MADAYVLMTAMPPTRGHTALIDFAARVAARVKVFVCTQPDEPFPTKRWDSIDERYFNNSRIQVIHIHREMEQNASAPGFWDMWWRILDNYGMTSTDMVVSSEAYGQKVADLFGAKFVPYDPNREIVDIKATRVRKDPLTHFDDMIPEFQKHVRQTITVFGAESVGKTTLSRRLAYSVNGLYLPEYARPYLEMVGSDLSNDKMDTIFYGQRAIQDTARNLAEGKPFVIQDTDLFSTVGYWRMYNRPAMNQYLESSAVSRKSDLYLILDQSEVPFAPDPLRYGGDKRETEDQYWIDLCEEYELPYVYLHGDQWSRVSQASDLCYELFARHTQALRTYERKHNG